MSQKFLRVFYWPFGETFGGGVETNWEFGIPIHVRTFETINRIAP